jgi:hypothetical protein
MRWMTNPKTLEIHMIHKIHYQTTHRILKILTEKMRMIFTRIILL